MIGNSSEGGVFASIWSKHGYDIAPAGIDLETALLRIVIRTLTRTFPSPVLKVLPGRSCSRCHPRPRLMIAASGQCAGEMQWRRLRGFPGRL